MLRPASSPQESQPAETQGEEGVGGRLGNCRRRHHFDAPSHHPAVHRVRNRRKRHADGVTTNSKPPIDDPRSEQVGFAAGRHLRVLAGIAVETGHAIGAFCQSERGGQELVTRCSSFQFLTCQCSLQVSTAR